MTVLVTRPIHQCAVLCGLLQAAGCEAVCLPALAIMPTACARDWQGLCARMKACHWLIFTSPNAAHMLAEGTTTAVVSSAFSIGPLRHLNGIAMGPGTQRALRAYGITALMPDPRVRAGSDALLQLSVLHEDAIKGQRIGLVTGEGGRPLLPAALRKRGAQVDAMRVYQRVAPPAHHFLTLNRLLEAGVLRCAIVTNVSALVFMLAALPLRNQMRLKALPLVVISERIQQAALRKGFSTVQVTAGVSETAMVKLAVRLAAS